MLLEDLITPYCIYDIILLGKIYLHIHFKLFA